MEIHNDELSPVEREIREKTDIDYGVWPEIAGAILTAVIIFILFFFSDGSY